jgi:ATPase family associated with various cellular activities (AAA)
MPAEGASADLWAGESSVRDDALQLSGSVWPHDRLTSTGRHTRSPGPYDVARSDLLISLVRAGTNADQPGFRRALEAVIAEERAKQHHILADHLAEYLAVKKNGQASISHSDLDESLDSLVMEVEPRKRIDELLLPENVQATVNELIEEHVRSDLLRAYGLEPRHRVLLVGPPGNGKTSLAEGIARELMLPLFVARYEGLIGSFLGETAVRLRRLFDFVRSRQCVVFFDEFDTLAKERGDPHDTGEVKRVVSSLLLQIDALPSYVLAITATNHSELLDRAAWRRFDVRLTLPAPSSQLWMAWLLRLETRLGEPLPVGRDQLQAGLGGLSFAELDLFASMVERRKVLGQPGGDLRAIVLASLAEIRQWHEASAG